MPTPNWTIQKVVRNASTPTVPGNGAVAWDELLSGGINLIVDLLNANKIRKQLKSMEGQIAKELNTWGGVLLAFVYCENPTVTEFSTKIFITAYVFGAAPTISEAFERERFVVYADPLPNYAHTTEFCWIMPVKQKNGK